MKSCQPIDGSSKYESLSLIKPICGVIVCTMCVLPPWVFTSFELLLGHGDIIFFWMALGFSKDRCGATHTLLSRGKEPSKRAKVRPVRTLEGVSRPDLAAFDPNSPVLDFHSNHFSASPQKPLKVPSTLANGRAPARWNLVQQSFEKSHKANVAGFIFRSFR
jgi:hypothetical protein